MKLIEIMYTTIARRIFYLLLHEEVQPIIKISPHIRVEMDPANTFRMWRGGHIVQAGKEARQAVHHHISEITLCYDNTNRVQLTSIGRTGP